MADWSDIAARARGLGSRSLPRATLERLAGSSVAEVGQQLASLGLAREGADARALEGSLRTVHAARLRTLARHAGARSAVLEVVFGEEDRRSVLALVRTVHAGRPGHEALPGTIPTPRLPPRTLDVLARQPSVRALGTLLAAWQHPLGPPLLQAGPDLASLERSLHRAHTDRLRRAARRGDRFLRAHNRRLVDLQNALVALVLARQPADLREGGWVPGGEHLDEPAFATVLAHPDVTSGLARVFRGTVLAPVFEGGPPEARALEGLLAEATRATRLEPLGTAPIVGFALRLRAEAMDVRTVLWGAALGAPAPPLRARLVTP